MRRLASFLTFLFGGAYIVALFNFSNVITGFTHNELYGGKYGFDLIKELVESFKSGFSFGVDTTFAPILVAAGAVFAAITAVVAFIGMFTASGGIRGTHVPAVITLVIDVVLLIVVLAVNKETATAYGLYIFLAAAVLMIIFGLIAAAGFGGRGRGRGRRGGDGPRGGGFGGPRGGGYGGPRGGGYGGPRGGYGRR